MSADEHFAWTDFQGGGMWRSLSTCQRLVAVDKAVVTGGQPSAWQYGVQSNSQEFFSAASMKQQTDRNTFIDS